MDWREVLRVFDDLSGLITDIAMIQPRVEPFYPWMNETTWMDMIHRVGLQWGRITASPAWTLQTYVAPYHTLLPIILVCNLVHRGLSWSTPNNLSGIRTCVLGVVSYEYKPFVYTSPAENSVTLMRRERSIF